MAEEKINEKMIIGEVIAKYPEVADVMLSYGLHCVGCHVGTHESIWDGALAHNMSEKKIEELVNEMNETVEDIKNKKISMSDLAVKKFKELLKEDKKEGYGLKLTIIKENSLENYDLDFAEKPLATDEVIEEKGLKIFIDKELLKKVKGTRINYVEGMMGSGFRIFNPNK